jgi:hypothetical protein
MSNEHMLILDSSYGVTILSICSDLEVHEQGQPGAPGGAADSGFGSNQVGTDWVPSGGGEVQLVDCRRVHAGGLETWRPRCP